MFGFGATHKKREDVRRILLARTNRVHLRTISSNNQRGGTRAPLTEVVWALPCNSQRHAEYASAFPAVTEDISAQGIAFIHSAPITESHVIVGMKQETGDRRFLLCTLKHCTPLEHGFFHVGLFADEVIHIEQQDEDTMRRAIDQRSQASAKQAVKLVRVVG